MNFAESRFWLLLLAGLAVVVLVRTLARVGRPSPETSQTLDKLLLCALGLWLLFWVSWVTFVVFLVVAVGSYAGLRQILELPQTARRRYLPWLIALQLLPLLYYKYAWFLTSQIPGVSFDTLRDLVIPVGISFYTFQKVGFVIDTLVRHEPLPRFLDYMNFAGFFPQIVAGPIERRQDLLPQMEQFRFRLSARDLDEGATWMAVGLFFKLCLADNLALYFDGASVDNAYLIWLANVMFGLRIYYDFAGYSLIALGVARCLGIRLTLNFHSPYSSVTVGEFWRRWHVTLSQWFRDYLYIPLGGSRVRWWALNTAVVFLVSGIWHGAGWNFVLWGALHGAALIVQRTVGRHVTLPGAVSWALTMALVFFAWLAFYEVRTDVLVQKMMSLLTPAAYSPAALSAALAHMRSADGFVTLSLLASSGVVLFLEWLSVRQGDRAYVVLRGPVLCTLLVIVTVILAPGASNGFIYFAF